MRRVMIAVDVPDDEPIPAEGTTVYVGCWAEGQDERYIGGLTGIVVADTALILHQTLYPENYPRSVQADHIYWQGADPMYYTEQELREQTDEELVDSFEAWGDEFEWGDIDGPLEDPDRDNLIRIILRKQADNDPPPFEWGSDIGEWVGTILNADMRVNGHPEFKE